MIWEAQGWTYSRYRPRGGRVSDTPCQKYSKKNISKKIFQHLRGIPGTFIVGTPHSSSSCTQRRVSQKAVYVLALSIAHMIDMDRSWISDVWQKWEWASYIEDIFFWIFLFPFPSICAITYNATKMILSSRAPVTGKSYMHLCIYTSSDLVRDLGSTSHFKRWNINTVKAETIIFSSY